ncbi:hypothetical protein [Spongiimicrobium sp. 3-5]|uniref:hypothetical protein n=1 Tax=Spongiimicrobium sp. 3-5 TaxID=3332596 RepID=UPI00398072FE
MKKSTFKAAFLAFQFLFLACTHEDNLQLESVPETDGINVRVEPVTLNTIPEITTAITIASGKKALAWSREEKGDSKFWINPEDILKALDSAGNASYALQINVDDPLPNVFYNLVVTQREDGQPIAPFVVEYVFETGDVFTYALDDEKEFDGLISIYSLSDFAPIGGLNARAGDAPPCFKDISPKRYTRSNNRNTGGSRGGNGGGSSSVGAPSKGPSISYGRTHISISYSPRSKGSVSVGVGRFHMPKRKPTKSHQKNGNLEGRGEPSNCPEGTVVLPVNPKREIPPSCKSFNYSQGINNTQTAAVKNISFKVAYYNQTTGDYRTSEVLFTQPIYFTIPRYHATAGNLTGGRGAELSAKALLSAHSRATAYFLATHGSSSQVRSKLWEYIRDEFRNGSYINGGSASFTPPVSTFNGSVTNYVTTTFFTDRCN